MNNIGESGECEVKNQVKDITLEMKEVNTTECIVCLSNKDHIGIHIGIHFICHSCEKEMVETDVIDDKYLFFIKRMRKLWLKENTCYNSRE